jgi:hypothetical protein
MDHVKRNIAFEIGWDYARFGIKPPDETPKEILNGYKAGTHNCQNYPKQKEEDYPYIKKWLQLRRGAMDRNRIFEAAVTPQFLKSIETPICPITLVRLTKGTRTDTDWSIDRLNNNGAYAVSNLAFISTKANKSKGNKSFADVNLLAHKTKPLEVCDGLTGRQWLRMACLMYSPTSNESPLDIFLPLATFIPARIPKPAWFTFQSFFLFLLRDGDRQCQLMDKFMETLDRFDQSTTVFSIFSRLTNNLKTCDFAYDALVDEELQSSLKSLLCMFSDQQNKEIIRLAKEADGSTDFDKRMVAACSYDTAGYLRI